MMNTLFIWTIRLLSLTWRFRRFGDPNWQQRLLSGEIVAHWHCHLLPLFFAHKGLPFVPIISQSKDGDKLAKLLLSMGYGAIRGSSSSGGRAAYLQAKEHSKAGISVVFAVDGPRGPKYKAKPGALRLSNELNKPILMFSVSVSRSWILSSWDGFMIPKPFAKIAIIADAPFWATSESDEIDYFSQRLRELSSLTAK